MALTVLFSVSTEPCDDHAKEEGRHPLLQEGHGVRMLTSVGA